MGNLHFAVWRPEKSVAVNTNISPTWFYRRAGGAALPLVLALGTVRPAVTSLGQTDPGPVLALHLLTRTTGGSGGSRGGCGGQDYYDGVCS